MFPQGGSSKEELLALPRLAARATAHAMDYLDSFHLGALLRGAAVRSFSSVQECWLPPNALRQVRSVLASRVGNPIAGS